MSKALATMIVGLASAAYAAESATDTSPPTMVSGIDVTPPRHEQAPPMPAVRAFVGSLSVMSIADQLAVWSKTTVAPSSGHSVLGALPSGASGDRICPVVFGLPPA